MSYRTIFTCDVCAEDCGRECMTLRFENLWKFKVILGGTEDGGRHLCMKCARQLREQLPGLDIPRCTADPSTASQGNDV